MGRRFTLSIALDAEDFHDDDGRWDPAPMIAEMFGVLADQFETRPATAVGDSAVVVTAAGEVIGTWTVTGDDAWVP